MMPGPFQIALIVLLVLLVFGAGKIPRVMGDMAKGINAFKRGLKDIEHDATPELAKVEKSHDTEKA